MAETTDVATAIVDVPASGVESLHQTTEATIVDAAPVATNAEITKAKTEEETPNESTVAETTKMAEPPYTTPPLRKRLWRRLFEAVKARIRKAKKATATTATPPAPPAQPSTSAPIKEEMPIAAGPATTQDDTMIKQTEIKDEPSPPQETKTEEPVHESITTEGSTDAPNTTTE